MVSKIKFDLIYIDPPWLYSNSQDDDPSRGGSSYNKMSINDLSLLPIAEICNKDCALAMWVTFPKLEEAFKVINAWGFNYVTNLFTWVKENKSGEGIYSGLGYYTNGNAEICLLAKKGRIKRIEKNVKQILFAPVSSHSKKPDEARLRLERLFGSDLSKIEIFATQQNDGWTCVGSSIDGRDIKDVLKDIIHN